MKFTVLIIYVLSHRNTVRKCTEIIKREPLTTADVTTANVITADSTANVSTADVTTANVTTADVLVLGYGLWVRVWVMVRVRVWVRP